MLVDHVEDVHILYKSFSIYIYISYSLEYTGIPLFNYLVQYNNSR